MSIDGKIYDRPTFQWVDPETKALWDAQREERYFRRQRRQGELCAPMIISDSVGGIRGVQSQLDGRFYDSKSNLRRTYREGGVTEVGNDPGYTCRERIRGFRQPHKRLRSQSEKDAQSRDVRESVRGAISRFNLTARSEDQI